MKVRVLYASAVAPYLEKEVEAGAVVTMDDVLAKGLLQEGWVETVERATKAPGEKRATTRKKKASG